MFEMAVGGLVFVGGFLRVGLGSGVGLNCNGLVSICWVLVVKHPLKLCRNPGCTDV